MNRMKSIVTTGLVVGAVMIAGVSVNAAGFVKADTEDTVTEMPGGGQGGPGGMQGGMQNGQSETRIFDIAVEEGIIDEDEYDAIIAYYEESAPDMESIEDEIDGMTKEEAEAYMEENYPKSEDPLGDLVDEGLLTDDQSEDIQTLIDEMPEMPEMSEGGMGGQGGGPGGMQGGRGMSEGE